MWWDDHEGQFFPLAVLSHLTTRAAGTPADLDDRHAICEHYQLPSLLVALSMRAKYDQHAGVKEHMRRSGYESSAICLLWNFSPETNETCSIHAVARWVAEGRKRPSAFGVKRVCKEARFQPGRNWITSRCGC